NVVPAFHWGSGLLCQSLKTEQIVVRLQSTYILDNLLIALLGRNEGVKNRVMRLIYSIKVLCGCQSGELPIYFLDNRLLENPREKQNDRTNDRQQVVN